MAPSSSDMYNKQMLITFKTYFMVMQIFMEVNCIIANFPQVHWREKVWLHSDDLSDLQQVKKYFAINLQGGTFSVQTILYYDN